MSNTKSREAHSTGTILEIHPNQLAKGDRVATIFSNDGKAIKFSDPLKNDPVVNPKGCPGKTHVDSGCYDNIAKVVVKRG